MKFLWFTNPIKLGFENQSHQSEKPVENELEKYQNFTLDQKKRGDCIWNSKSIRGTLKKRWPDVIGLGFGKVSFVVISKYF